jgi:RNA polymerase sigma factor, sigma-70 family
MGDFSADVKLAQEGSSEAFSRLYALIYKDMYHIALYSLRNSHDACDVVSDTVLDAFCSIKKLRDPNCFKSWIMRILSAKIKRMQRGYFSGSDELNDDSGIRDFDFDSVDLREAIEKLDNASRLMLSLSVLEGYSSEEISKICDIKASTVRSRLSRIKKLLRIELTPDI